MVVFKIIVNLELHVGSRQRLKLLKVGHVLFRILLGLSGHESHEVEVERCQSNIKESVRVNQPRDIL